LVITKNVIQLIKINTVKEDNFDLIFIFIKDCKCDTTQNCIASNDMVIIGHTDMETPNVYRREAGMELKDRTKKFGYKVPPNSDVKVFKLVSNDV